MAKKTEKSKENRVPVTAAAPANEYDVLNIRMIGNTTGFPTVRFHRSNGFMYGDVLVNTIDYLDPRSATTAFEKLTAATPYLPITLMHDYLSCIAVTDGPGMIPGVTPVTTDRFTAAKANDALRYLRAMLGVAAVGSACLGYEDVKLTELPDELSALRTLVPKYTPIVSGKALDDQSTVRVIYLDSVCFALASPYTILAPSFESLNTIAKEKRPDMPWMAVKRDAKKNIDVPYVGDPAAYNGEHKAAISALCDELISRLMGSLVGAASDVRNECTRYITILNAFKAELGASDGRDMKAVCDLIMQEKASDSIPEFNGLSFMPGGRGAIRCCEIDGKLRQFDLSDVLAEKKYIGMDQLIDGHASINEDGVPEIHVNRDGAEVSDYRFAVNGACVYVSGKVTADSDDGRTVSERVEYAVDYNGYFVRSDLVRVTEKADRNRLLADSNFVEYNGNQYLIPTPAAPVFAERTSIGNVVVSGGSISFTASIQINNDLTVSKRYENIPTGLSDDMTDIAVWPPVRINSVTNNDGKVIMPGLANYYLFTVLQRVYAAMPLENEVIPAKIRPNVKCGTVRDRHDSMFTYKLDAYPETVCIFNEDDGYCGFVRINVRDAVSPAAGVRIRWAVDFGTSNTTVCFTSSDGETGEFNCTRLINSAAYTQKGTAFISSFFVPCNYEDGMSGTFRTLMHRRCAAALPELFKDCSIYFNSTSKRNSFVDEVLDKRYKSVTDRWELLCDLKATEIAAAEVFLRQLILMICIESRLRGCISLDEIDFTFPLSFSNAERNDIKKAVSNAAVWLSDRHLNAGYVLNPDVTVGIQKGISESNACIVFGTVSAKSIDDISDLVRESIRGRSFNLVMVDVGGGTVDIATALRRLMNGTNVTNTRATSMKFGARKQFIIPLVYDMATKPVEETILYRAANALGFSNEDLNAYRADIRKLSGYAKQAPYHPESMKRFIEEFEYMICIKPATGAAFGERLGELRNSALLAEHPTAVGSLIKLRSILSLSLLFISVCVGFLMRDYENGIDSTRLVLAGNGSKIFNIIDGTLKNALIYYGMYIGRYGCLPAAREVKNVVYFNDNYSRYIKKEVARGALDYGCVDVPVPAAHVTSGVDYRVTDAFGNGEKNYGCSDEAYVSDYFFGDRDISRDQPVLKLLLDAYSACCTHYDRSGECIRRVVIDGGEHDEDSVIALDPDNIFDGAVDRFNKLPHAELDYTEAEKQAVRESEMNGSIEDNSRLFNSMEDHQRFMSCDRVSPLRFLFDEICSQIAAKM